MDETHVSEMPAAAATAAATAVSRDWLWRPRLIVFISNACVMIIELVAGRIVAPFVGVSLYTWTSVIGVILAGMSAGNFLGGFLADRFASRRTLGLLFVLGGLGSLSVLGTAAWLGEAGVSLFPGLPLVVRMVLYIAVIFFLPSMVLGTISPLVVKLTLQDLKRTGNVIGGIYASSALGSIVGTFATGYFLIAWFGTRAILLGVGVALLVMGIVLGQWVKGLARPAVVSVLLIALAAAVPYVSPLNTVMAGPCMRETNYFCIRVREQTEGDGTVVRVLTLDRLVHSYSSLDNPRVLRYSYEKVAAEVAQYMAQRAPVRSLFIGGGGYTFPRYLEAVYPGTQIDVAEIDPGVTETAYQYLGLPLTTTIKSYNEDARLFLKDMDPAKRYNLVLGDAFNDFSVPYHLTTREFDELVRAHMTEDGVYMLNLIDGVPHPFVITFMRTLKQVFGYVYLIPSDKAWETMQRNTYILLASPQPIDMARLRTMTGNDQTRNIDQWLVPDERAAQLLQTGPQYVLSDDYVPTDNLLTPVFEAAVGQ